MFSFNNTNKLCKSCHCNPCCCQTTCVTRRDVVKINWKQLSFTNDDQSAYVVRTSDTSFDISANVSPDAGNALIKKPNGLYVDDSQFSFLVSVGDTQSVNLSGTGILGDPILADIIISPNAGNALTSLANGLFVATPASISYDDTQTIDLSFAANILTANARISGTAGNILTSDAGGLYVPTDFIQSIADTNSIDLAVSGLGLLTANTKISASAGNIATINPDGIYVPSPSSPFISSIDDTDTINLSVSSGELTADAIISTDPGNILINNNGLYIAQAGNNGLSLNISSGNLVLGQDIAELGDPAQLLSSREIPISTYDIRLTGTTGKLLTPRFRTGNNFSLAANRNNSYPFVVLTNQDDPSSTDAAYGGGSIDIRTGYNLVAPPGGADAIQVGLTISGQINSSNTQNWGAVGDLHPKWMNMAAVLVAVNGASGNIHKSAGFYSSFKNDSPTLSFEEVNLIDLTYDHTNPTTVNHANGIRIADYDMGNNGCGIFMVLGDSIAPPSGRWDIYSQTGYNSYLNGSLQIGSDTSLGSEKLQVTGSAVITNSLETRNSSDNNLLNSQGIGKTLIGGSTPLTGITTMLQVFGTTSFNQPVAIGGQFDPLYPLNITMGGSASAIHIGGYSGGSDIGGYITSSTDASLWLSGGASFNGTVWRAKATTASTTKHETGLIQFFTNSGLTVGNTFTPTERARINTSGNLLVGTTTDNGNRFRVSGNSDISGTLTVSTLATGTTSDNIVINTSGLLKQVDPATLIAAYTPNLQQITDVGNTTTNSITISTDGSTTPQLILENTGLGSLSISSALLGISFENDMGAIYSFDNIVSISPGIGGIYTDSITGGVLASNNLTISSTSDATKGKILFGNSAYDEANNRLGINTTTTNAKLEVIHNTTQQAAATDVVIHTVAPNGSSEPSILIDGHGTSAFVVGRRSQGTAVSPTVLNAQGFNISILGASGYHSGGAYSTPQAGYAILTDEAWTATAQGTQLIMSTTENGTTTSTPRMIINNLGKVSVGDITLTNPIGDFHIFPQTNYSAIGDPGALLIYNQAGLGAANILLGIGSNAAIIQSRDNTTTPYKLGLNSFGGNVGVGNGNPSFPLDVSYAQSSGANNASTGAGVRFASALYFRERSAGSAGIGTTEYAEQIYSIGAGGIELYTADATPVVLGTNATERLTITSDGRIYGTALHNNAGAVTGTTNQYIASGTYTPSITNGTNVSASTARQCQWIRVGNVVTVSGSVNTTVTSTGVKSTINISLPISSTFSSISNLAGSYMNQVTGTAVQSIGSSIYADTTNNDAKAEFNIQSTMTNPNEQFFTFTYIIL